MTTTAWGYAEIYSALPPVMQEMIRGVLDLSRAIGTAPFDIPKIADVILHTEILLKSPRDGERPPMYLTLIPPSSRRDRAGWGYSTDLGSVGSFDTALDAFRAGFENLDSVLIDNGFPGLRFYSGPLVDDKEALSKDVLCPGSWDL